MGTGGGTAIYGVRSTGGGGIGTVTNVYDFYAKNPSGGTITNKYGVYVENITGATNNYAIYSAGGQSYLAGNVGIGTTAPTYPLSFSGQSAQEIWMERETTAATAGNSLTLAAGGAKSGGTDLNGGNLVLQSGTATGNNSSSIVFQTVIENQGAGAADRAPATSMILSSGALTIPAGNASQQPGQAGMQAAANGMIRYNTGTSRFEVYENGAWKNMQTGSGTAAGSTTQVQFNSGGAFGANANFNWDNANGRLGIGTAAPSVSLAFGTTDAVLLPSGTTGQQPAGVNGMIRYNSTNGKFEGYQAGAWTNIISTGGARLDQISAATGVNTINSAANAQEWDWNSLTTGNAMTLGSNSVTSGSILFVSSSGTAAATGQKGLNIALGGTNGTAAQTTYGAYIANTHDGTTSTNVGLYATATGGTTANYAAIFAAGNVGIGTTSPSAGLTVAPSYPDSIATATATLIHPTLTAGGGVTTDFYALDVDPRDLGSLSGSPNVTGIRSAVDIGASPATNVYDFYGKAPFSIGGAITNAYGLYLENITGATNNYAIYSAGGQSYLAGNVGIGAGATTPGELLFVSGGNLVATGTWGSGPAIAESGAGTRMMWYPKKGAFRAGGTSAAQWDDANIGIWSTALGLAGTASGNYSTAFGFHPTASGTVSTVLGAWTVAAGTASTALGQYVMAGDTADVNGNYSMAIGLTNTATANYADLTGTGSLMIAMQDQHNVVMTANNAMALLGGKMIINPATAQGAGMVSTPDTALDVRGSIKVGDGAETCGATYAGAIRYNTGAVQFCNGTAWANIASAGGARLDQITAATGPNTINNGNNAQNWQWNTLGSGGTGLSLSTTTTAAGIQKLLNMSMSGIVPSGSDGTSYGAYISDTHTSAGGGGTSTNIGLYATASGGTSNYAAIFDQGNVGIGTTAPTYPLSFTGQSAQEIWMERETTAATPGFGLTVAAGGAVLGGTDKAGGDLTLSGGTATGTADSKIIFKGAPPQASTSTTDNVPAEIGRITGGGYVQFTAATTGSGDTMLAATGTATPGAGTRMVWYPRKAAFRVGTAVGTEWDDANIGQNSMAFGLATTASGSDSAAFGRSTIASGSYSTASGFTTTASGMYSTAIGISNTASGPASTAFGQSNTVSGNSSTVGGYNNTVSGTGSTAFGGTVTASGFNSTALGAYVMAGDTADTNGNNSMAIGLTNTSTATYADLTGTGSLMIAMQDQHNVVMTANNAMALLGGSMIINPATGSGAGMVSTPATALDVRGSIMMGDGAETCASGSYAGAIRYNTGAVQFCNGTAWANIAGAGGARLDQITAATGANTINSAANAQEWDWNSLTTGNALTLGSKSLTSGSILFVSSSGTAAATGQKGLNISLSGNNGTPAQTTYGAYISNTHTNAVTGTNVGLYANASGNISNTALYATASGGAAANYAAIFAAGNVGIGTVTPSFSLSFTGQSAQKIWMERETTAATPGFGLTVAAGGAVPAGTDKAGGDLTLSGGTATGTADSKIIFKGSFPQGSTNTTDNAPTEIGRITGGGYVQFTGTQSSGDTMLAATGTATPGAGTRMVWYPNKGAFRAGGVSGTAWNDANIGIASTAFGGDTIATGTTSTAMGNNTTASGYASTAGGYYTTASGNESTAFGQNTTASGGWGSTAMGYYTTAAGSGSTALGQYVKAGDTADTNGNNSLAIGLTNTATANYPKVTGTGSLGIFMQDQHNVVMAANNAMALLGGSMIINPATGSGAGMVSTPDTTLDVRGEVKIGNTGLSCSGTTEGAVRYNSTSHNMEFCNGTSWAGFPQTCNSATPAPFSFTNQTGVALSTLTASDIVQLTGFTCSISTSITGTGSPAYRICSDSGCSTVVQDWTTVASAAGPGQYVQLRLTSNATGLTTNSATLIAGTASGARWDVTTVGTCSSSPVGTVCTDGSVYAGLSVDGNVPMYAQRCDAGQTWSASACTGSRTGMSWNNGTYTWVDEGFEFPVPGKSNTAGLAAKSDGASPHLAAQYCAYLNEDGHMDWYLPSQDELATLYSGQAAIGNFDTSGTYYWTSTEINYTDARDERFSDGGLYGYTGDKINAFDVRCVRR